MIRILIVAVYASVRAGLRALLTDAREIVVVEEAGDVSDLERLLQALQPDVVLFDDYGEELPRVLATVSGSEAALVVLSDDRNDVHRLASSPIRGWAFLGKEADGPEIEGAIRAASAGLIALDRSVASELSPSRPDPVDHAGLLSDQESLTPRELEVLQVMAQGLPNKQIAARLDISLHTVKFHVASILSKLDASSRTEAVTLGARRGLVSL